MNVQPLSGAPVDLGAAKGAPSEFRIASANPDEAASRKIANLDLQTHPLFNDTGNRVFDLGDPAAVFLGGTIAGGESGFLLLPIVGDDDESDKVRLPTGFYSRTLGSVSGGAGALSSALTAGIVATVNPNNGQVQLGPGSAARVGPFLAFVNTRNVLDQEGNMTLIPNADGEFRATINFGFGISLNDTVSGLSRIGSKIAALIGGPAGLAAAGGLQGVAAASDALKGATNIFSGLGYAIEVRGNVNDPDNLTFYQNGREIDLEATIEALMATLSGEASEPTFFPEGSDSPEQVRAINDIIALAYGTDPFELASQRRGHSEVPAIRLAQEASDVVTVLGSTFYPFLSEWGQSLAAHGPQSTADVARFLQEVWNNPAMPPQIRNDIVDRLANAYGINFGIPEIAVRNEAFAPAPDYDATREALGVTEPAF